MRNTLADLNDYLFESLERLNDDSLDTEGLDREIKRSEAVSKVAAAIIGNAELQLKALAHAKEYGYNGGRHVVSKMLPELEEK